MNIIGGIGGQNGGDFGGFGRLQLARLLNGVEVAGPFGPTSAARHGQPRQDLRLPPAVGGR